MAIMKSHAVATADANPPNDLFKSPRAFTASKPPFSRVLKKSKRPLLPVAALFHRYLLSRSGTCSSTFGP
jgi:hypothetical protein